MSSTILPIAILITILQVLDFYTTYKAISSGGKELNPIVAWLMKYLGLIPALVLVKGYVAVFVLVGASVGAFDSNGGFIALAGLFVVYAVVVLNNLKQYYKR